MSLVAHDIAGELDDAEPTCGTVVLIINPNRQESTAEHRHRTGASAAVAVAGRLAGSGPQSSLLSTPSNQVTSPVPQALILGMGLWPLQVLRHPLLSALPSLELGLQCRALQDGLDRLAQ